MIMKILRGAAICGCLQAHTLLMTVLPYTAFSGDLPADPTGSLIPSRTAGSAATAQGAAGPTIAPEPLSHGQPALESGAASDDVSVREQNDSSDIPASVEAAQEAEESPPPSCTFFLVRHGQSKPNVAGRVVSGMKDGIDPKNGLTAEGLEQARAAGRELKDVMLKAGCLPANTMILTSPLSRAKETAEAIRECLDCELREESDLRERWFGDLDGREDASSYKKVWALDAVSALHSEFNVEPASMVGARTAAVVRRSRQEVSIRQRFHTGDGQPFPLGPSAVILVSHGDALQLLQCSLANRPFEQHRSLPHLDNCGIRVLRPPPIPSTSESRGCGDQTVDGGRLGVRGVSDSEETEGAGGRVPLSRTEDALDALAMRGVKVLRQRRVEQANGQGRGDDGVEEATDGDSESSPKDC